MFFNFVVGLYICVVYIKGVSNVFTCPLVKVLPISYAV